ncbi:MAG: hypothetical protein LQ350_007674 [Teloschistes chrysophthalmus]|nr:MAG: hypothetical protein LQ350_007674 [Niorma chrysophthalma]
MGSVPHETDGISSKPTAYRLAIIGGGIGGLTLAIGLLKYPHIDVQVYEAAPSFGEIGAGVAFGPNAQRALALIGNGVNEAFLRHATSNMWASHANCWAEYRVGKGEHEGEIISAQRNFKGMKSLHRAHFLEELVKLVPGQRAHFNKRLVDIKDDSPNGGKVTMTFEDGTSEKTDAVIGADGVHSAVRLYLLGEDHPAAKPVFTGAVAYRGLVPMDAAIEKVGAEIAQNSIMLCGPGKATISYPIDFGKTANMVLMDYEYPKWENEKWIVPCEHSELVRLMDGWGPAAQGLVELLDRPSLSKWSMWDLPAAPYYSKERVVMMGDAAHATTPFQGQGAGQAIEDSLVLETLLGRTKKADQLPNVFAAFDQVRRPRSQRIVVTSREAGQLMGMKQEGVGDDLNKMRKKLDTRMHWIWDRDMLAQNDAAINLLEESF